MNKFKKILLGVASVLTLGALFTVSTIKVKADSGSYIDKTFDSSASNTGWTYSDVSSNSSFEDAKNTYNDSTTAVSVGKLSDNKVIKSPTFANEASQIVVTVYVGTTGSSNGLPFLIKGYNGDDLITTVTGYTPKSKTLGCACSDANGTEATTGFTISNTSNQTYTHFVVTHEQSGKGLCFVEIDYTTTDAVVKTVSSISATNKTAYYVGDTFASTGFEVTATYSDLTNAVLASSKYTVTVKDSNDDSVTGAFVGTGTYTATIVLIDDNTISTTCDFTVGATYTITYYLDGVLQHTDTSAKGGSSITYKPTLNNQGFDGWYTDSQCTNKLANNFTVSEDKNLYGKTVPLTYELSNSYIQTNHGIYGTNVLTSNTDYLSNTIFKATTGCQFGTSSSTYGETTYNYLIKTNGSSYNGTNKRTIEFVAPSDGFVTIWVASNSEDSRVVKLYKNDAAVSGCEQGFAATKTIYEIRWAVDEGATYDIGGSNGIMFYNVKFTEKTLADDTTASVFAEKNAAGDTLRFIGTLEGITELDNVTEVELILKKDGVASKKRIILNTCYTSVSGSSQACEAADGTYYVIYRLKGITGIEGTISKQLKITFADGSTKLSDVTEFNL